MKFKFQHVLITGGSRGLGLALAKAYLSEGASVSLIARDAEELKNAKLILSQKFAPSEIHTFVLDITKSRDVFRVFEDIVKDVGAISVIVNNAGSILVAPYDSLTEADFQAQVDLHLFAVIRLCRLAVDHFRENKTHGRIVNICSLGGKIAVPHMMTYDASKFALAGYSQALTAELAKDKISVTTVYPTVMRTGSPIQAVFKGDCEKEYQWFATTDALPFLSLDADKIAKRIVHASDQRKSELIPSAIAKLRLIAGVLAPDTTAAAMALVNKLLPKNTSKNYQTGAESESSFKSGLFFKFFSPGIEKAKLDLNQQPKSDAFFNAGLKHEPPAFHPKKQPHSVK